MVNSFLFDVFVGDFFALLLSLSHTQSTVIIYNQTNIIANRIRLTLTINIHFNRTFRLHHVRDADIDRRQTHLMARNRDIFLFIGLIHGDFLRNSTFNAIVFLRYF